MVVRRQQSSVNLVNSHTTAQVCSWSSVLEDPQLDMAIELDATSQIVCSSTITHKAASGTKQYISPLCIYDIGKCL